MNKSLDSFRTKIDCTIQQTSQTEEIRTFGKPVEYRCINSETIVFYICKDCAFSNAEIFDLIDVKDKLKLRCRCGKKYYLERSPNYSLFEE